MNGRFSARQAAGFGLTLYGRARATFVSGALVFGVLMAAYSWLYFGFIAAAVTADPENPAEIYEAMAQTFGWIGLIVIALIAVSLAMQGALYRRLIHDDPSGWLFGFRLGMDELRIGVVLLAVGGILFGAYFASYIAMVIVAIVGALVAAALAAVLPGSPDAVVGVVVAIVGVPAMLLWVAGIYYVMIRFTPAAAASVAEKRIVIFEAWRMAKGRIFKMFLAYVLVSLGAFAAILVCGLIAGATIAGTGGLAMMASGDPRDVLSAPGVVIAVLLYSLTYGVIMWAWFGIGAYAWLHRAEAPGGPVEPPPA